jgi:hypothetical protein
MGFRLPHGGGSDGGLAAGRVIKHLQRRSIQNMPLQNHLKVEQSGSSNNTLKAGAK